MYTWLIVRVLHVLFGGLWVGAAFLATFYVMPSIVETGPDGGKVMLALLRRKLPVFMAAVPGLTVVTGIYLYWRFTDGFDPGISQSRGGLVFGTGGVLGLIALILAGSVVGKNLKRAGALFEQASGTADASARAKLLTEAGDVRGKAAGAARIVTVMVIITIMLMALGHYV